MPFVQRGLIIKVLHHENPVIFLRSDSIFCGGSSVIRSVFARTPFLRFSAPSSSRGEGACDPTPDNAPGSGVADLLGAADPAADTSPLLPPAVAPGTESDTEAEEDAFAPSALPPIREFLCSLALFVAGFSFGGPLAS